MRVRFHGENSNVACLRDGENLTRAVGGTEDEKPTLELNGHLNIGATATDGNTDSENYYLDGGWLHEQRRAGTPQAIWFLM